MEKEELLTCAFCGKEYPPGTPTTQHAALSAHIEYCQQHPMFTWKQRALLAEAKLATLADSIGKLLPAISQIRDFLGELADAQKP